MLRVATYNVRSLRDDRAALVRVISAMRPDVLCLQEAPRLLGWRRRRRDLAHDVGMRIAAGVRVGGTAIYLGPAVRLLYGRGHRLRWFAGLERRGIAVAIVDRGGVRYAVCSAHLDLAVGARLRHATQIVSIVRRAARAFDAHVVLAGDLNEQPDGPAFRYLAGRYTDCFAAVSGLGAGGEPGEAGIDWPANGGTFPARDPAMRIDAVFADPDLDVAACGGAAAAPGDLRTASDHRPVVADVRPRRVGDVTRGISRTIVS